MFHASVVNSINAHFANAAKSFHAVQSIAVPATPADDTYLSDYDPIGYDHFQERAEVDMLRGRPRHARSILMDSGS